MRTAGTRILGGLATAGAAGLGASLGNAAMPDESGAGTFSGAGYACTGGATLGKSGTRAPSLGGTGSEAAGLGESDVGAPALGAPDVRASGLSGLKGRSSASVGNGSLLSAADRVCAVSVCCGSGAVINRSQVDRKTKAARMPISKRTMIPFVRIRMDTPQFR